MKPQRGHIYRHNYNKLVDKKCPACALDKTHISEHYDCASWRCPRCKFSHDTYGLFLGFVMSWQRNLLGLTRKDVAKKLGISHHTIKKYEWCDAGSPTAVRYKNLLKRMMRKKEWAVT